MKDYNLIKYCAKISGANPKKDKEFLYCYFPYGKNAVLISHFFFEKGCSQSVAFDLTNVYELYGSKYYPSCNALVQAIVNKWTFFETLESNGKLHVYSDLTVNRVDNTCSQALTNVSVLISCINELLNMNADTFSEKDWRDLRRNYISDEQKKSKIIAIGSLVAAVLAIVLFIVSMDKNLGGLTFLSILLFLGGVGSAIFFFLRNRVFKMELSKSYNEKTYKN